MLALASDLTQAAVPLADVSDAMDALHDAATAADAALDADADGGGSSGAAGTDAAADAGSGATFTAFAAWWRASAPKVRGAVVSDWFLVRQLYKKYDQDGSGLLERDEVSQMAQDHGITLDAAELDVVVQTLDKDGDGLVGFDEFERWWKSVRG